MPSSALASTSADSPRIWVTTYGLYNAGALIGFWFEPDGSDQDDVIEELRAMVKRDAPRLLSEVGEELMICDHENWGGLDPQRFPWDELEEIAELVSDDEDRIAFAIEICGANYLNNADDIRGACESLSVYEGSDKADAAYNFCEEMGVLDSIPEHLRNYFDCESYADDSDLTEVRRNRRFFLIASH